VIRLQAQEIAVALEPFGASFQEESQPLHGEQAPGDPGREQGTEEAVGVGEERPAVSGGLREAVLEARDLADRPCGAGLSELVPQRGISGEEMLPGLIRGESRQIVPGSVLRDHEAGAHRAMVEGEDVHPSLLQDVMDGRLLVGIGAFGEGRIAGHLGEVGHSLEVSEDEGRMRLGFESVNREVPGQKAAGAGGVDQKVGLEANGLPVMRSSKVPAVSLSFHAVQVDTFQDLDSGLSGFQYEMMIHVLPQPVGVRDGVVGACRYQQTALVGWTVGEWLA